MTTADAYATAAGIGVLIVGFAYAAVADWREREVSDRLWQGMGGIGVVLGALALARGGALPVVLWIVVGLLTLEHVFPWDVRLGDWWQTHANHVELLAYVVVLVLVGTAVARAGIGATGVPWVVIALLSVVFLARGLFELGVLYGGADAKALMIAALLVPVFPVPWLAGQNTAFVLAFVPFPVSLLTNAALLSIIVPIVLAVRNVRRGEFSFPSGFTGYSLPVEELPRHYVWVKDPAVPSDPAADDVETSAEDTARRTEIARDLTSRGIRRVWVSPQVPFLTVMALGAFSALIAGNLLLDLLARI